MPNVRNAFAIPAVRIAASIAGGLILAALIFDAGVDIGARHHGPPGPDHEPFMAFGIPLPRAYMNHGHGTVGEVRSVGTSTVTIASPDGDQDLVWITGSTIIETPQGPGAMSSLATGTKVIIIGSPNESREHISAILIRVLPPPSGSN
jgi:hypothetical protein